MPIPLEEEPLPPKKPQPPPLPEPLPEPSPAPEPPQAKRPIELDPQQTPTPQAEVDPRATVRGQMKGLLAEDSPYIQGRRASSTKNALARGLINTTMMAEAGEAAAINAAMGIAVPDAATYAQYGLQNLQTETSVLLQRMASSTTLSAADLQASVAIMGQQMDIDSKWALQDMVETNKRALQSDASISTAFSNTMTSIAGVYQNPEMNEIEKKNAAEYFMSSFKSYVEFQDVTGGSNYADQFDWGAWDLGGEGGGGGGGESKQTPEQKAAIKYSPFTEAGSPGEIREKAVGNRSIRYRFNANKDKWDRVQEEV